MIDEIPVGAQAGLKPPEISFSADKIVDKES